MLKLTDFEAIKAAAIKTIIPPEQLNLSTEELELKNETTQIATREANIFTEFLQKKHEELDIVLAKNIQLNQEIDQAGLISLAINQSEILENVESHIQKDLENREPAILTKVKLMESESNWKRFRSEHNLTDREAKYPEDLIVHFAPIFAITSLEALAYTNFYRKDGGLLDGLFLALLIAVANLVACGLLGYVSRFKNVIKPVWKKTIGFSFLIITIIFAIWFNGTLTFYRDKYTFIEAAFASLKLFILNWPFKDIEPFVMWILGIVCSMLAWYKGYTLDDKYPGYSKFDKDKKKYQAAYDQEINKVMPDKTIQKLVQELENIIRQANNLHRISNIEQEIISKEESYINLESKTNEQLTTAITYFREHQLAIRANGISAPQYFDNPVPPVSFRKISTINLLQKIHDIQSKNRFLDERIKQYIIPTLKIINTKKPQIATETKREFIKQVDKAAQERIFS